MCSFYQVLDGQNLAVVNIPSARFIRFYPKTWLNEMCMRVQVYKEVGGVQTGTFLFLVWARLHKGVGVLQKDIPITTSLKGKKRFLQGHIIKKFTSIPWLPMIQTGQASSFNLHTVEPL